MQPKPKKQRPIEKPPTIIATATPIKRKGQARSAEGKPIKNIIPAAVISPPNNRINVPITENTDVKQQTQRIM